MKKIACKKGIYRFSPRDSPIFTRLFDLFNIRFNLSLQINIKLFRYHGAYFDLLILTDPAILKDFENASPRLNPLFHKP